MRGSEEIADVSWQNVFNKRRAPARSTLYGSAFAYVCYRYNRLTDSSTSTCTLELRNMQYSLMIDSILRIQTNKR